MEPYGWKSALDKAATLNRTFPLLHRATIDKVEACDDSMIYWRPALGGEFFRNYVEIVRESYSFTRTARRMRGFSVAVSDMRDEKLLRLLERIEYSLQFGVAQRTVTLRLGTDEDGAHYIAEDVTQTSGGFQHLLRREELFPTDHFHLRGSLVLMPDRQPPDMDGLTDEWMAEFSLEVNS